MMFYLVNQFEIFESSKNYFLVFIYHTLDCKRKLYQTQIINNKSPMLTSKLKIITSHLSKNTLHQPCFTYSSSSYAHFYHLLGLSMNATADEVKAAYYRKAKEYHPDITQGSNKQVSYILDSAYNQLINKIQENSNSKDFRSRQGREKQDSYETGRYANYGRQQQQFRSQQERRKSYNQRYKEYGYNWGEFYEWQERQFNKRGKTGYKQHNWDFQQKQLKEFQKAFNSYLRNGYLKDKYKKYKPYIQEFFRFGNSANQQWYEERADEYGDDYYQDQQFQQESRRSSKVKDKHKIKKLDIGYRLQINQSDLGDSVRIKFERQINCQKCFSKGKQSYVKIICKQCQKNEEGSNKKCPKCKGKGYRYEHNCKACRNSGTVRKIVQQIVVIPLGFENGSKIVMEGRGHQHKRSGIFGDLVISIHLSADNDTKKGKKKANNGFWSSQSEIVIDIFEAVLGCMTTIESNKGETKLKIPSGIQPGESIKNTSGEPKNIKVNVHVPYTITAKQKQIYEKLRQLHMNKSKNS